VKGVHPVRFLLGALLGLVLGALATLPLLPRHPCPDPLSADTLCLQHPVDVEDVAVQERLSRELASLAERGIGASREELLAGASGHVTVERLPAPTDESLDLPELYARCAPSVYLLGGRYLCPNCERWHVRIATAFAVTDDGLLVTNHHVLETDYELLGASSPDGRVYSVVGAEGGDPEADLAVVRIEAATEPLPLKSGSPVGAPVAVISHPRQRAYTLTEGILSRRYARARDGRPALSITAEYAVGSSGAPVLDKTGAVVGVAAVTQALYADEEERRLQMVVKECVPVEALIALLDATQGPP